MNNLKLSTVLVIAVFSTQIFAANLNLTPSAHKTTIIVNEGEFLEVDVTTLPKAVLEAVKKDHEGAAISKAFVNKEGVYKLVLTHLEKESTVYSSAEGEWLEL